MFVASLRKMGHRYVYSRPNVSGEVQGTVRWEPKPLTNNKYVVIGVRCCRVEGVGIRKPACPWNGCYWTRCQSVCFAANRCNAINLPNALAVAKRATLCFDTRCRASDRKQLNEYRRIPQISSGFFLGCVCVCLVVVAVIYSKPIMHAISVLWYLCKRELN